MYNFSNNENVTKLDRTTIADGDNLNAINILPLSSRDSTLLNDLNETYDVVDDVTTTVSTYSGSWQNSAISGFSAIQVSSLNDHSVKKFVGGAGFTDRFTIVTYPIDLFRIGLDSNGYFRFSAADMLNAPTYSSYYKLYKTLNGTSNIDLPGSVALRWSNCNCTDYSFTDSLATPDDNVSHSSVYIPFIKDENGNDTTDQSISFSEGDTTNKSLNLSYNTKSITIRNDYFNNTDVIDDGTTLSTPIHISKIIDTDGISIKLAVDKNNWRTKPNTTYYWNPFSVYVYIDDYSNIKQITNLNTGNIISLKESDKTVFSTYAVHNNQTLRLNLKIDLKDNSIDTNFRLNVKFVDSDVFFDDTFPSYATLAVDVTVDRIIEKSIVDNCSISLKGANYVTNSSFAIHNSTATDCSLAIILNSYATNSSFAFNNATAVDRSFALKKYNAEDCSFGLMSFDYRDSVASSFAHYYSDAYSGAFATQNSYASGYSFAGYWFSTAHNHSFAIKGSIAKYNSFAYCNSTAVGAGYGFAAVESTTEEGGTSFALVDSHTYWNGKSIAAVNSTAKNYSVALLTSEAEHSSFAILDSIAVNATAQVALANSLCTDGTTGAIAICNSTAQNGADHSIAIANSVTQNGSNHTLAVCNSTGTDSTIYSVSLTQSLAYHTGPNVAIGQSTAVGIHSYALLNSITSAASYFDASSAIALCEARSLFGNGSLTWNMTSPNDTQGFYATSAGVVNGVKLSIVKSKIKISDMQANTKYIFKL